MRLQGKTALVTGSGRNIGKAIALDFAAEGARVVVNAHAHREEAEAVAKEARALGAQAITIMADVSDPAQVKELVRRAVEAFGPIDILVSNVGIRPRKAFHLMTYEDWRYVFSVNLDAAFLLAKEVVPSMMERRWGRIITFAGLNSNAGAADWVHVCTSKTALSGFTRALAVELGPYNILVNTISPGAIREVDTPGLPLVGPPIPLGRVGRPVEIAKLCTLLCCEDGGFITGQTIHVNGGALRVGL